jgi:Putative polyhydroxyalkanoic acid system protein (PHA_gran_rgn)
MRITVSHNKGQQEAIKIVDGATDQVVRSIFSGALQMSDFRKEWNGPQMTFSVNAGLGGFRAPINGSILVTDSDITLDCVLPALLESLASAGVRDHVQGVLRGVLT